MKNLCRTLILISFSCALVACGSGGEDVNQLFDIDGPEVEVPPDNDLTIEITRPTANGSPTGYQKIIRGTCGTAGILIRADVNGVEGNAFSVCNPDETFSITVDTSNEAVGSFSIAVRMIDEDVVGNADTVTVNKLSTICDSPARRADTFANTSTTGVPPWQICTNLQLTNINAGNETDDFELMNDIDFSGGSFASLGSTAGGFEGTFEGNNFEISSFVINQPTNTQYGLFREATGATFQNISFYDISISARYYIGLLAGYVENTAMPITATNITAENITLEAMDTGNNGYTGGLFGRIRPNVTDVTISDVTITNINIPSLKSNTGGVVGVIEQVDTIDFDRIEVVSGDINGHASVGGIIGAVNGSIPDTDVTFDQIKNGADVTCSSGNCGGIAGYANGEHNDIGNTGTITRLGGNNIGGLFGYLRAGYIRGSQPAATREAVTPPAIPTSTPPTDDVNGRPESCYNTGDVVGPGAQYVGGIVGNVYRNASDMTSCWSSGAVTGGVNYVGGAVGYAERLDITDSFATGNVIGEDNYVGGLAGRVANQAPLSVITNSYASGDVTSAGLHANYVGGLIGQWQSATAMSGLWYNGNIVAIDGDDTGRMENIGGLIGHAYVEGMTITNAHTAGSILVTTTGTGQDHRYIGGLFGISRVDVDLSSSSMDVDAQQARMVGGLIGYDYRQTVTNSYATGDVVATDQVGGLIGYTQDLNNVVEDSFATGNVTSLQLGGSAYAGGLIGASGAHVRRCYASGDVLANNANYVGGLEGGRTNAWDRDLIQSFATGNVDAGTGIYVGGLSGYFRIFPDRFTDNFATGTVRGGDRVGGLIGYVRRQTADNGARRNYAYGRVTRATGGAGPDSRIGPLYGQLASGNGVIEAATNYYNSDFMPQDEATALPIAAPNLLNVTPLSSAQMTVQGNFVGFDFGTPIWEMPVGPLVLPGQAFFYTYPVPEWIQ